MTDQREEALRLEIAKLQRFKDFVHRRLDEAGIPTHPDGPHSAEGCRIGDRLDIALARAQPQQEAVAFWMIERLHSVEHEYGWWFRGSADPTDKANWTTDATKAAHFPSGESAACALSALKPAYIRGAAKDEAFYKLVKPTEHMWFASPPAQAIPEGWQLVPKELTEEMIEAGNTGFSTGKWLQKSEAIMPTLRTLFTAVWRAMLAAAPQPGGKDE